MVKAGLLSILRSSRILAATRSLLAGRGSILMLHEIHETGDAELRTGVTVAFLEHLLPWLRENGWEIVSMDKCAERLSSPDSSGRFVTITFDDGYRDNVTRASPVMQRYEAPFTIYVPTAAINRELNSWWLGLRAALLRNETVEIEPMGASFRCADFQSKIMALDAVCQWVHEDYRRQKMLDTVFKKYDISLTALNAAYFLDERELQKLALDPLVTIGGHTTSHAALSLLDDGDVYREMSDNRAYLEGLLQEPVAHFAYPFGNCGEREFAIATDAGFATAVTTVDSPILKRDYNRCALPRLGLGSGDTAASLDARVSGLKYAVDSALSRMQFSKGKNADSR